MNETFLYCLGLLAEPCGIEVHAFCMMSNHYHVVLTDRDGNIPEFMQRFNRLLALCIKQIRGWDSVVWEPNVPYSAVVLETPEAVLDKVAYTVLNPVSAGLVSKASQWAGPTSASSDPETFFHVNRPEGFFGARSPATVTLRIVEPPAFRNSTPGTYAQTIGRLVLERQAELRAGKRRFLGVRAVLHTRPQACPRSAAGARSRNPQFAAVTREALQRAADALRVFRHWYREAFQRWRTGDRGVEFPPGTWWLVRYAGAVAAANS